MLLRLYMAPSASGVNTPDCGMGYAVLSRNSALAFFAFKRQNLLNLNFRQLAPPMFFTLIAIPMKFAIRHVFALAAPSNVSRIAAPLMTIAARMQGHVFIFWGGAVGKLTSKTVHILHSAIHSNLPISRFAFCKRPNDAIIGGAVKNILCQKSHDLLSFGRCFYARHVISFRRGVARLSYHNAAVSAT